MKLSYYFHTGIVEAQCKQLIIVIFQIHPDPPLPTSSYLCITCDIVNYLRKRRISIQRFNHMAFSITPWSVHELPIYEFVIFLVCMLLPIAFSSVEASTVNALLKVAATFGEWESNPSPTKSNSVEVIDTLWITSTELKVKHKFQNHSYFDSTRRFSCRCSPVFG